MASSSDLAAKAKEAFIDDHFELAVDYYSQAIALDPHTSHLFSHRSQAHIKLNNFTEAVADANKAIELDSSNAKAYLRKGTACFSLEEYHTAKAAFEAGSKLAPEDARFTDWIKKCEKCIAEEDGELPTESSDVAPNSVVASSQATEKTDATSEVIAPTPAKPKYRHEFYQKPEEVVVTIFAKGIPANSVFVNYGEQILSVTIDVPGEDSYIFQPRLFGKIVPAKCRHVVLSTKVEIRLAKAELIQWTSLEFGEKSLVAQPINVSTGRPVCYCKNRCHLLTNGSIMVVFHFQWVKWCWELFYQLPRLVKKLQLQEDCTCSGNSLPLQEQILPLHS